VLVLFDYPKMNKQIVATFKAFLTDVDATQIVSTYVIYYTSSELNESFQVTAKE